MGKSVAGFWKWCKILENSMSRKIEISENKSGAEHRYIVWGGGMADKKNLKKKERKRMRKEGNK